MMRDVRVTAWATTLSGLALILLALMLVGCDLATAAGVAFQPDVKARHKLAKDRPTLVIVDDPLNQLGDPGLSSMMATRIGHQLREKKQLKRLVPPEQLVEYSSTLGQEFKKVPADRIGQKLGAEQIILVHVESVEVQAEPGMMRPAMAARVRVIDAKSGKRIFPSEDDPAPDDPNRPSRGFLVPSVMFYRFSGEGSPRDIEAAMHRVAERSARDVARVFHKYKLRDPAESLFDRNMGE